MLFILTLDLIENSLLLFYVCPWKVGPYVYLGSAEIELQNDTVYGSEGTKLN